jgi:hypothetical protein
VAVEPIAVVEALRALLPASFTVGLEWANDEPYAAVTGPNDPATWVHLKPSISAFPTSSADEIASFIAESERWP